VATRSLRSSRSQHPERGVAALQLIVLLGPVFLIMMGFAVDLGRLYSSRAELKTAADAMALAAAGRLIGTDSASEAAAAAAQLALSTAGGVGNRYDFGGLTIGETGGLLTSETPTPEFFDNAAGAIGEDTAAEQTQADSAAARYVRVTVRAEAPLVFFGLLAQGQERKTQLAVQAVAGVSAPLCTICGQEVIAVAPINADDTVDFGFVADTRYTLGYQCQGGLPPPALANTTQRIQYLLLDGYNVDATTLSDEGTQAYRIGVAGLPPNTNRDLACLRMDQTKILWASATTRACNATVNPTAINHLCGLAARFDNTVPDACAAIPEVDSVIAGHPIDSDTTDLDTYAGYTGNTRRVITAAIVDALNAAGEMTILGWRQFLIEPSNGAATLNIDAQNGRFPVLYIGSPVPVRQGSFAGCTSQLASGPGKVVLYR